ncbi:MAG: CinA family protein [Novosphingobium sp.]
MIEDFTAIARRIADMLLARGEKIAVADGASGGLISAALLTVPGALRFHVGGGVVYSLHGRNVLLALPRDAYRGMESATPAYALLQARAIAANFKASWAIAETGSAGGSGSNHPMGVASGVSCAAVIGPGIERARRIETGSDDRAANMLAFTSNALDLLETTLREAV